MLSDQQVGKELMDRNWSFKYFEELGRINTQLKETGASSAQVSQLIEADNELKDADFRAAAFELLELKKKTGKNSKEVEVYIKQLDSQITSKEKQKSDCIAGIEKAKGEFKDWEQKCNEERTRFESERTRNEQILKEDNEKLSRELSQNNEIRQNIEETIKLKAELKKIKLDLPAFKSIVIEIAQKAGISQHTAKDVMESVQKLGSLNKAIAEREKEEKAWKQAILNLSGEEREKMETLRGLDGRIAIKRQTIGEQDKKVESRRKLLEHWDERIERNKWQYEFFELFISMLLTSPSAPEPLLAIGLKIQELSKKRWTHSTELTFAQCRAVFIMIVMGGYLHSIHCGKCGASFIVNKPSNAYLSYRSSYDCPVCDLSSYTKPDDTFFDLMVSPELVKKLPATRAFLEIMEKMDPEALVKKLKLLDSLPSEIYKALSEGRRIEVKVLDGTN